jgi:hypothetical protein
MSVFEWVKQYSSTNTNRFFFFCGRENWFPRKCKKWCGSRFLIRIFLSLSLLKTKQKNTTWFFLQYSEFLYRLVNTAMLTSFYTPTIWHPKFSYHISFRDAFSGNGWIKKKADRKSYYIPATIKQIYMIKARESKPSAYVVMYSDVQICWTSCFAFLFLLVSFFPVKILVYNFLTTIYSYNTSLSTCYTLRGLY